MNSATASARSNPTRYEKAPATNRGHTISDRPRQSRTSPRTRSIRDIPERPHIQARLIQLEATILSTNRRNIQISHLRLHIIRKRQNLTLLPRLRLPFRTPRRLNHQTDDITRHRTLIPDIPILRPLTRTQLDISQRHPITTDTTIPLPITRNNGLNPINSPNRDQLIPSIHLNRAIDMDPRSHIRHDTSSNPSNDQTIDLRVRDTSIPRLQPSARSLTIRQTRIIGSDHNLIIPRRISHVHRHRLRYRISVRASRFPRSYGTAMRLDGDGQPVNRHQRAGTTIPDTLNATKSGTIRRKQERIDNMPIIIGSIRRGPVKRSQRMQHNITHKSFLTINHSDVDTPILPTTEDSLATSALSSSTSLIAC